MLQKKQKEVTIQTIILEAHSCSYIFFYKYFTSTIKKCNPMKIQNNPVLSKKISFYIIFL